MRQIDVNCDMGEGLDNEDLLMPLISSCNISCGAHAGSEKIMNEVIQLAVENNVKFGAHPSYEDRENFGRVILDISNEELRKSLVRQMSLFKKIAKPYGKTHHVKPHGALYNLIAVNQEKAALVADAIEEVFGKMKVYVPFNSVIENVALDKGMPVVYEVFADRNYNDDLTLVSRSQADALLRDPKEILTHVQSLADGWVKTLNGLKKPIKADTFCVHGDNPRALDILKTLQQTFSLD